MQVTETLSNGLKRELKVIVGSGELGERFNVRLNEVKDQVQIKGFRKGKVPPAHIKKLYGRSLMLEVLEATVEDTSRQAVADRKERPAVRPDIKLTEDKDEIERIIVGTGDLAYTMSFEVLPEITLTDFSALALEREVAEVDEEAVTKAIDQLIERGTTYEAADGRSAEEGDQLTIDFLGQIDGVPFDGGKAEKVPIVIGRGGFIPGFEDGLKGIKAGDERAVTATFPAEYGEKTLAGKTAVFDVKVSEVAVAKKPVADDAFAATLGVENLDKLKELIRDQIKGEYAEVTRLRLKRNLLDQLDKSHNFILPESLVESEFQSVWQQVQQGLQQAGKTLADEGKTEDEAKAEYRRMAERRVRLGLVIGEVGDKQQVKVEQEELRRALISEARRYPGREKMVYEYYEKNPAALTGLRAPIFEEKVVDYIVSLAKVTDKTVSREELLKPLDDEMPAFASGGHSHDHDHEQHHDAATCTDPTHNH